MAEPRRKYARRLNINRAAVGASVSDPLEIKALLDLHLVLTSAGIFP